MKGQKKNPLYKSFGYAFEGIFTGIKKERNMKIHCLTMLCLCFEFQFLNGVSV